MRSMSSSRGTAQNPDFLSVAPLCSVTGFTSNRRILLLRRSTFGWLSEGGAGGRITALMPGKILRLEVSLGDAVTENQTVATMESMKMESALHAPQGGRVGDDPVPAGSDRRDGRTADGYRMDELCEHLTDCLFSTIAGRVR